ncbi:MAG: S26 family signal peptidase [Ilumatobacteraceae bacterium]
MARRKLRPATPPVRHFVVADRSMEPTLVDGQGLICLTSRRARPGQLRCFEHPERPGFWLVKRVAEVHVDGSMSVSSDNAEATIADSRSFGPVPVAGSYRVLVRIPRRWM